MSTPLLRRTYRDPAATDVLRERCRNELIRRWEIVD
jgi:hypothetical protein